MTINQTILQKRAEIERLVAETYILQRIAHQQQREALQVAQKVVRSHQSKRIHVSG